MRIFKDFFELIRKVVDDIVAEGVTLNPHNNNLSRRTGELYETTFKICSKVKIKISSHVGSILLIINTKILNSRV